ncbi:hypothetical protein AMETH_3502 [Amycolatopsis methanolica 239]|uniref:Uncharacterized protein n=1 Tax=Amycolatopsis methanolica 239 TaxID=1068978 RepID=A0A076MSJ3_AMYME|nr:hypothetical protein AMETH_3502 [Amycolatopsis methanolica 239]
MAKRKADETTPAQLHGFAAGTYPPVRRIPPEKFVRARCRPVRSRWARCCWSPRCRRWWQAPVSPRSRPAARPVRPHPGPAAGRLDQPTEQGVAIAKDVWMFGIAASMVLDHFLGSHRRERA